MKKTAETPFQFGRKSFKSILAPDNIDRTDPSCLRINNIYARTFALEGYPAFVQMCWLDRLFNYNGDMDVCMHIQPFNDSKALNELSAQITKKESELITETERGSNKNITMLQNEIQKLYQQRMRIEQSLESLYHVEILNSLYASSKEELDKKTTLLHNELKGSRIKLNNLYFRQDKGLMATLPLGDIQVANHYRNMNSDALADCNPFYNADISHENGTLIGINLEKNTGIYVDFYNRKLLNNGNIAVFGESGSGKTFLITLLSMRSALQGVKTAGIDPEGELSLVSKALGGTHIELSLNSGYCINPFDLEEEIVLDKEGNPTNNTTVQIKEKVADLVNLIAVMAGGFSKEEESFVATVLDDLYQKDFQFSSDSESLYQEKNYFDDKKEILVHGKIKKEMPTFSDFHHKLTQYTQKEEFQDMRKLALVLRMFKKEGIYGLFDGQTNVEIDMNKVPILTFGVSQLDESLLRPLAMYVCMSFLWEKFVKKYPKQKKRIILDEAWQLMSPHMKGSEYTAAAIEKYFRRIRKRNGGVLIGSQSFLEFKNNPQGEAVLGNAKTKILLRQPEFSAEGMQELFKLTDGEKQALLTAGKGEFLIKLDKESAFGFAKAFPYEKNLIEQAASNLK